MTQANADLHVYLRSIEANERTSLSVLASHISPGAEVLDLGCGSGALGKFLKTSRACMVDGVTLSEVEARHARPDYRRVEVADLEQANLPEMFVTQRYDAIVCADVLEHLPRPERILAACRKLLKPDGKLLISVPNAGYCGLVAELLQGDFRYREEGLLDHTHLRFFTRKSLSRFMAEHQWALEPLDTITREVPDSEFDVAFDLLPPAVARYMLAVPDALTYQFIGVAHPAAHSAVPISPPRIPPSAQALFTAQLYIGRNGQFDEEEKITGSGVIGKGRQTLTFQLPSPAGNINQLRLDPADRPGFLHLYSLTMRHANGTAQWQWSAANDSHQTLQNAPHDQIVWNMPLPAVSNAALLLLSGDDPWVQLPIPSEAIQQCLQIPGARIEVDLGWPMSADYMALSSAVRTLETHATYLETSIATARQSAALANATAQHSKAEAERMAMLCQEQAHWQAAQAHWQAAHAQLMAHVQAIEGSNTYKATRTIVRATTKLRQLLGLNPVQAPVTPQPTEAEQPSQAEQAEPAAQTEQTEQAHAAHSEALQPTPAIAPEPANAVDIIVPAYKGLEDTRRCIQSVLASHNQTPYRLIVINDASPEPELTKWLRNQATQDHRIHLLENTENLGFVGTVNRGMALNAAHDVLLLNSDTEVANNWLDRLHAAAYASPNAGTVTPFSNNATICSYPLFCRNNALPNGHTTATLDALMAHTNPGTAIDVPTGVGFCMYVRRDCLAQVGLFDTEHFGKGYGEENDFCIRAAQAGWRNLQALDTFVLHTGGVSFGDSKSPREQAAMKTLQQLHPHYEAQVQAFVAADPARPYREAIDLARLRANPLPRVLTVVHSLGGGTLRHTLELADHLKDQLVSLSLTPLVDYMVRLQWVAPGETMQRHFHWPTQSEELLQLLREIGVVHVHYHHLLGLDPEMMRIPERLGIPYDFTAHDYYTACPQIALVDTAHAYCGERGLEQCKACVAQRPTPTQESIEEWRLRHTQFLANARNVLTPSKDAGRRMIHYFPTARVHLAPHLDIAPDTALPTPQAFALSEHANLRVLVIGAVSQIKGGDVLEATAIEAARSDAPIEFHLMGYAHKVLKTQPAASLSVHGAYDDQDLHKLLQRMKPDLVWFPAQWPETYSYTLSACLKAGVPVVVPNLGAFAERVSLRAWTWVMPWDTTPHAWLQFFMHVRSQHFLTGKPPACAPVFAADETDMRLLPWSYPTDYLQGISAMHPSDDHAPTASAPTVLGQAL